MIRPEDLAGVLDAMLEGLQVLGPDWRYLHVNGPAARHGRCRPSDLLGRVITDCYPGIEHTEVFAAMRRSMTERVPQTMESAFRFADGSTGHFELRIEPVPQGICVLSIDVTDRRDAESARRSAEDRLA
jgi:two-component system cell cycle sensor histidine kinase/response regulator CckA